MISQLTIYWFKPYGHPYDLLQTHICLPHNGYNNKEQFAEKNNRFSTYSYPNMKTFYLKLLLLLNLSLTKKRQFKVLYWTIPISNTASLTKVLTTLLKKGNLGHFYFTFWIRTVSTSFSRGEKTFTDEQETKTIIDGQTELLLTTRSSPVSSLRPRLYGALSKDGSKAALGVAVPTRTGQTHHFATLS